MRRKQTGSTPIVKLRFMATGLVVVTLCIAGPLLLVWKQAYIASTSMRIEAMTDTVSALNRQIATLQLLRDRLSSNDRIERVARSVLRLDYPSSDRIVIVPVTAASGKRGLAAGVDNLLAIVQGQSVKGGRE
jgi:cell division protein FtsL